MQYRALTISQPYASLIASGEKWIENRHWTTHYRGPLLIHAGQGTQYLTKRELLEYPTGIIAIAELTACFRLADVDRLKFRLSRVGLTPADVKQHEHTEGPWCWLLQDVRKLDKPIPCRGRQNIWFWNGELPCH